MTTPLFRFPFWPRAPRRHARRMVPVTAPVVPLPPLPDEAIRQLRDRGLRLDQIARLRSVPVSVVAGVLG